MTRNLRKRGFIDRHALEVMSEELADMQRADETLVAVRRRLRRQPQ